MYALRLVKVCLHVGVHSNYLIAHNISKNGKFLSTDLEMNLFKAATLSVNYCTSFVDDGDLISKTALIFFLD